jgi:hypothetical protein
MKLDDLIFWVSPLTGDLFVGTKSKRDPHLATQSRNISGLMVNGIVEWMRTNEHESVCVTQEGKRFCLRLEETNSAPEGGE